MYLTMDSAAGRKQHRYGWKHRENFRLYYEHLQRERREAEQRRFWEERGLPPPPLGVPPPKLFAVPPPALHLPGRGGPPPPAAQVGAPAPTFPAPDYGGPRSNQLFGAPPAKRQQY